MMIIEEKKNLKTLVGFWGRWFMPFFVLLFLMALSSVHADQSPGLKKTFQLVLKPQSRLWLNGDSTLHPFASTATKVNLSATFEAPQPMPGSLIEKLSQADVLVFKVVIPVKGLESGEKGLDKNLHKALKSEVAPTIQFLLSDKRLLPFSPEAGMHKLTSHGALSIAGQENIVQMESQFESVAGGIHVVGQMSLLMSAYGVKPPTILGFIKVKDNVTIHFDLWMGLQEDLQSF